jgi:hypothetical protein
MELPRRDERVVAKLQLSVCGGACFLSAIAWAFEPEDQPASAGTREFSQNAQLSEASTRTQFQCVDDPSSLLLVANRIDATKTTMMTGTTKNGDVMFMTQTPVSLEYQKRA